MENIKLQNGCVPSLRFPEFEGEWVEKKLGEVTKDAMYGMNASAKEFDGVNKYIRITDISESDNKFTPSPLCSPSGYIDNKFLLKSNDLVLARTGASTGKSYLYDERDGKLFFAGFLIKYNILQTYDSKFIFYQTLRNRYFNWIQVMSMRSGQPGINAEEYKEYEFNTPSLLEQTKIAEFLSCVDERIGLLSEKKKMLETYKRGVMQKLFSQEIRFKDDNGNQYPDWQEKSLGEIFERITRKNEENNQNVLTISAQQGLINQLDFFNRYVASKNLLNYYLLEKNNFAYNKSYSKGYPVGAIKRLKYYDKGVVSVLYICFKSKVNISNSYFEHYFEAGLIDNQIKGIAQEGARNHGLLNIGVSDFFSCINLQVPFLSEQSKIADFLTAIDDKLTTITTQIADAEQYKKGLLQQMFV